MKDISRLIDIVLNEVSGKYALDWAAKISQYNRVVGSKQYHEIIEEVVKELKTFDLDELKVHKYPADGKTKIWEWIITKSWEIESGGLCLMEQKKNCFVDLKKFLCVL